MNSAAAQLAALVAEDYGRFVAALGAELGDLVAAEECLSDALAEALHAWERDGVPARAAGWLLTVARRRAIDRYRRQQVAERGRARLAVPVASEEAEADAIPDRRLALLFVCSHPGIDPAVRAPLMLQTVFSWDAARIAGAFLVAPATMAQRLVRAKTRIRESGIPFAVPAPSRWPERLADVLAAIYAVYTAGTDGVDTQAPPRAEAIRLARLVAEAVPDEPEAQGLLALCLLVEARRPAARDPHGEFIPLAAQDPRAWDAELIREAETRLRAAAAVGRSGRYQLEAAIQSAHTAPHWGQPVDEAAILRLYDALLAWHPSVGAQLGRCAALARSAGPAAGLAALAAVPSELIADHQPAWALRGELHDRLGAPRRAAQAFARAAALCHEPAVRRWLEQRAERARSRQRASD